MRKALLAAVITGLIAGAVIVYLVNRTPEEKAADDIEDAAEDTFNTMNKTLKRVERKTEEATGLR